MLHSRLSPSNLVLLILALAVSVGGSAFAGQSSSAAKPRIVVTALSAPAGDSVAASLASTITSSINLVLRLTGSLQVERADFLTPSYSFDHALEYYRQVGADSAVFGTVAPNRQGEYVITMDIWSASSSGAKPNVIKRTVTKILDAFSLADAISLEAASTVVGRKLAEGTLVVKNVGRLPAYAVYVDGHLLGRNRSVFHVLSGKRVIIVAKRGPVGDIPVQTFHVDVRDGQTTTATLSSPSSKPTKAATVTAARPASPQPAKSAPPATATVSVTTQGAGTLYVDKIGKTQLLAGATTNIPGISPGLHTFEMVFNDGQTETRRVTLSPHQVIGLEFQSKRHLLPPMKPDKVRTLFGRKVTVGYAIDGVTYRSGFLAVYSRLLKHLVAVPKVPASFENEITKLRGEGRAATAAYLLGGIVGGGVLVAGAAWISSGNYTSGVGPGVVTAGGLAAFVTGLIIYGVDASKVEKGVKSLAPRWNSYTGS